MPSFYENHRDDMERACAWYARDDHCPPHFHKSVEVVYVLEGVLSAVLDGEEIEVRAGQVLINSSFVIHKYETKRASRAIIGIIPLSLTPGVQLALSRKTFRHPIYIEEPGRREICALLHLLARYGGAGPAASAYCNGLGQAVLALLIERVGLAQSHRSERTRWVREVLNYLEANYAAKVTVEAAAAQFGYSKSRFSHLFNEQVGMTFSSYMGALRSHRAAQLMAENPRLSLLDIALQTGFDCPRTFYRAFKRAFGVTPSQYRQRR